jgi:hypothetical protein
MKNMGKLSTTLLTMMILLTANLGLAQTSPSGSQEPAVLKEMPADSAVVIACYSIDSLSKKLNLFAQQIGMLEPGSPAKVEEVIWQQWGLTGMIDASAGFGVCISDITNANETTIMFLPVLDGNSAMQSIGAVEVAGSTDIRQVPMGPVVKMAGRYLMMAENAEILNALGQKPKGVKLSSSAVEIFAKSDVAVTINLAGLMPKVKEKILKEMTSDPEIQKHPSIVKVINMATDRLSELQSASVGILLGEEGVNLKTNVQAAPNSTLAKYLSNHPTTDISKLAKLPGQNFILAGAVNFDKKMFVDMAGAVIDAIAGDPSLSEKINQADLKELKALLPQMCNSVGTVAMYAPGVAADPGAVPKQIIIGDFEDTKQAMESYGQMCSLITKISTQAGFPIKMTYKKAAGEIDGVSYDEITTDMSEFPMPDEAKQGMTAAYGGQPQFSQQFALLADNTLVMGMGQDALKEAIALVKNKTTGLDKNPEIIKAAKNLPSRANALFLVDVGKYMQMASGIVQAQMQAQGDQGMNPMVMISMMLGQIKESVGASLILEDGTIKGEVAIPIDMIKSAAQMVQMMMGAAMGSQMPPGQMPPGQSAQPTVF